MDKPILVCYATLAGSTAEVAGAVADILRQAGAAVDVRRAREVRPADIARYSAVVLGTGCRFGKVYKEAADFVRRHAAALERLPVAYFTVGLTMRPDAPPEKKEEARGYFKPLRDLKEPVAVGQFAGVMDYKKLSAPLRMLLSRAQGPEAEHLREGDWRDWDAIRSWARNLAPVLVPGR